MFTLFDRDTPPAISSIYPRYHDNEGSIERRMREHLRPAAHDSTGVRLWLLNVMQTWNLKPTTWAKAAGMAPSTLNKFLETRDVNRNLNASTINRLSSALQVFLEGFSDRTLTDDVFLSDERNITEAQILGDANQSNWLDPETYDPSSPGKFDHDPFMYFTIRVKRPYYMFVLGAFDVIGPEMEPIFSEGDLLVCAPVSRLEAEPRSGSFLVAHEISPTGQFRNKVMQFVVDPAGGRWLMPVGKKQEYAAPVYVNRLDVETWPKIKATFLVIARISNAPFG